MDFNNEITNKAITVLATQISLTKSILSTSINWSKFSTFYSQLKAETMKTINGKLVTFKLNESDEDLVLFPSSEIDPKEKIESLQVSLEDLELRIADVEGEIRHQIQQNLKQVERKTNQKLLAIALTSVFGFGVLGIWINSVRNPSIPVVNSVENWKNKPISQQ